MYASILNYIYVKYINKMNSQQTKVKMCKIQIYTNIWKKTNNKNNKIQHIHKYIARMKPNTENTQQQQQQQKINCKLCEKKIDLKSWFCYFVLAQQKNET